LFWSIVVYKDHNQYFKGEIMKNLLVTFGLCILLVAETQAARAVLACQQANGRFTYDHPTRGKLTELTQAGLDSMRIDAGESTTTAVQIEKCTEPKVRVMDTVKSWFKQFTADEKQTAGPSIEDGKAIHSAKSGDFEAVLFMTQDSETILTQKLGMTFTYFEESVSINMGEGIEALLVIRGCLENSDGNCLVTADYVIKAPDGSVYQKALNTDVWKEPTLSLAQYNLTNTRIGFVLQDDADPGPYKVYVTVSDKIGNTELSLIGKVVVNAMALEEKGEIQGWLEDKIKSQPKTPAFEDIVQKK
jgi:hypothetical protein